MWDDITNPFPNFKATTIEYWKYRKTYNISRILVVDDSDVVGASPAVGAAPTTSSFST